jgi:hypothetical protein
MSLVNLVEIDTPFGHRGVELHHGNLARLPFRVDVLCLSVYQGSYAPVPGTLVAALRNECELDVGALAASPCIDLGDRLGVWLSQALPEQAFRHVACVAMRRLTAPTPDARDVIASSMRHLFTLLLAADLQGVEIRSLALPLLGTGSQELSAQAVLPTLMDLSGRFLQRAPCLERIVFMDLDAAKVEVLDDALNRHLARAASDVQRLPATALTDALVTELTATLRRLRVLLDRPPPRATGTLASLIDRLDAGDIRFFELAILGRKFAEELVGDMRGTAGSQARPHSLMHAIEALKQQQVASWMVSYLHTLRVFGNEAAHTQDRTDRMPHAVAEQDVMSVLFCLNRVAVFWVWYREERM